MRWARPGRGALLAVVVTAMLTSAAPAATPRGWQQLLSVGAQGTFPIGWASGRVWFLLERNDDEQLVYSARVTNGRLTSVVANPIAEGEQGIADALLTGSNLVGVSQGASRMLTLLPSGKVSGWSPLPNDPVTIARAGLTPPGDASDWAAKAAASLGSRKVWALPGRICPPDSDPHHCTINGGGYSAFAVCCTTDGQPVDLTSLLTNRVKGGAAQPALGVDAHGVLWLAWLDADGPQTTVKLVQLDPATLQPRGVASLTALPGVVAGRFPPFLSATLYLACGDSCTAVIGSAFGAFRWGGSGPATSLWRSDPRKGTGGALVAAGPYGGGFALAWYGRVQPSSTDLSVELRRADRNIRNLHEAASIVNVQNLPRPGDPTHIAFAAGASPVVTPSGLVTIAFYRSDDKRPDLVLASVLRG